MLKAATKSSDVVVFLLTEKLSNILQGETISAANPGQVKRNPGAGVVKRVESSNMAEWSNP